MIASLSKGLCSRCRVLALQPFVLEHLAAYALQVASSILRGPSRLPMGTYVQSQLRSGLAIDHGGQCKVRMGSGASDGGIRGTLRRRSTLDLLHRVECGSSILNN